MLKTISAALLAVFVFAAPASAGDFGRNRQSLADRDGHVNSRVFDAHGWAGR